MSEEKNKIHEYDDGEMTQEDWDDLVERMHSQNPGIPLTEEEKKLGRKRSEHIHKLALEELKKQGYKI